MSGTLPSAAIGRRARKAAASSTRASAVSDATYVGAGPCPPVEGAASLDVVASE